MHHTQPLQTAVKAIRASSRAMSMGTYFMMGVRKPCGGSGGYYLRYQVVKGEKRVRRFEETLRRFVRGFIHLLINFVALTSQGSPDPI